MEGAQGSYVARTPEEVFRDYRGRRAGMIKALTTDVEKFFQACDPDKENLCLYGLPTEQWDVALPAEEVPPEMPEPVLGINFARDGMDEKDWLALVAVHSDAWLLAVAFYFGARFGFDKEARRRLFNMINNLPTIYEVVTGTAKKQQMKEKTPNSSTKSSKPHPSKMSRVETKPTPRKDEEESGGGEEEEEEVEEEETKQKNHKRNNNINSSNKKRTRNEEDSEEEEEEQDNALCGSCGTKGANDEFWICCDLCERWFHGRCVKVTPAKAEHIKQYKCPDCTSIKRK
ncbi:hypothetical protein LUZ63_003549 [Rhynchospora breviuscula]|uniref:PHD finger protein ALFIN-LIKE n=1 Tax=Rhynchospora breviuscula TaxID=2022672 RepID=A0A9Q0HZI1_9POAL|nr:hypothetical protein LUZ63_003549 [Rhynchospora breviuscula]